ncbi:MAG TPA: hypothetical protein VJS90_08610 [Pseudomonas sp.]|uniref:hypothetical protein n=1 Tax=Pseudomonas sp. TaxID=306 RepID=UPI002B496CED|nr:hypothetical protein [Pseudomonas sp.]HKS13087.1 hypothetical protein [Pseudomonas sp.]
MLVSTADCGLMGEIMLKPRALHIPIRDIGVLIATSLALQGLARRKRMRPCRPWIWFKATANAHSTAKQHADFQPCVAQERLATFAGLYWP